jgi:hypothetical protein
MKTKVILTINGIIHMFIGVFLWVQAVVIGKAGILAEQLEKKAPGQELTDGIYLVVASTVDTVAAFNIGIGAMLLVVRSITDLDSARRVLAGQCVLVSCALIFAAFYNQIFMEGGPPIPVFVLLITSFLLALYGSRKGTI